MSVLILILVFIYGLYIAFCLAYDAILNKIINSKISPSLGATIKKMECCRKVSEELGQPHQTPNNTFKYSESKAAL